MHRPCSRGWRQETDTYVGINVRASSISVTDRLASCAISNCESWRPLLSPISPSRSGCAACLISKLGKRERRTRALHESSIGP